MLTLALQTALNKTNDWILSKNKIGNELSKTFNCVKGNWKFSRDGGAVGDYNLKGLNGVENVSIPAGAHIVSSFVYVKSAVTSGGALTLDVNANAANDCLAAEAVAGLTTDVKVQGNPDFGTLADSVSTTAARVPSISLNTAAATAGEIDVYFFYVF